MKRSRTWKRKVRCLKFAAGCKFGLGETFLSVRCGMPSRWFSSSSESLRQRSRGSDSHIRRPPMFLRNTCVSNPAAAYGLLSHSLIPERVNGKIWMMQTLRVSSNVDPVAASARGRVRFGG